MSSLETSVTLDDVFTVVEAKRVPLAPELAGYLALEIADGTDAGGGDVDPKTVFISEEGTVALVRPKRDVTSGDAEASVRKLLTKLLDASGSGTPALTTAAKRKPGNGLPALVEELEAALIPVNRSAGRRALARLAREVKRVLMGVGRNASAAPVSSREPAKAGAQPRIRPTLRRKDDDAILPPTKLDAPKARFEDEPATAKRNAELIEKEAEAAALGVSVTLPNDPESDEQLTADGKNAASRTQTGRLPPPPTGKASPPAPPPQPRRDPTSPPEATPPPPPAAAFGRKEPAAPPVFGPDDVDSLLDTFGVSDGHEDKAMARELKAMAGLSPTPPIPEAKTLAELTKDVGKDLPRSRDSNTADSVEALLALADASSPLEIMNPPKPADERPPPQTGRVSPLAGSEPGAPAMVRQGGAPLSDPRPVDRRDSPRALPVASERGPAASGERPKIPEPTQPPATSRNTTARRTREAPRAPRTGMAMLVIALVVLAGGTAMLWKFVPQVFTGKRTNTENPVPTTPVPPAPRCKVALVLTDVPTNAEILLRVGQAPVDVERMPVGTRLELVATAEGYAPRRAVIKADAAWEKGADGKPRVEVPIQLDPSKAKGNVVDAWPAAEPGSQVGGSGAPGTVHVVSNVRGAEVWLLAGLGPEARIEQLHCDGDIEVLFAGTPSLRKRLRVQEKDIAAVAADAQGNKVVSVSAASVIPQTPTRDH